MACFDVFDADHDAFITEAEFNAKVLASSFSFAILGSIGHGNNNRREYEEAFDMDLPSILSTVSGLI